MPKQTRCNMCGKILDMWDESEDFSMVKSLGYGTIYDGEKLSLKLCCSCMETLINSCKINPLESENK